MDNIDKNNQILFVGSHTHNIDEKKRFIFPSSLRNLNLLNRMYVFPHPELPCLNIYFTDEITRRLNKLRDESIDEKESHAIRSITSSADLISLSISFSKSDLLTFISSRIFCLASLK